MRIRFAPLALISGLALACSKDVETPPPAPSAPATAATQSVPAIRIRPTSEPAEQTAAAVSDPRADRLAALETDSEDATQAYFAAMQAALGGNTEPTADELNKVREQIKEPDSKVWVARAQQLLDEDPTDLTALHTIQWMLDNSNEQTDRKALLALIEKHHLQRPEMGDMCDRLARQGRGFLEKLAADSPHADVRGRATYAMAEGLKD
ncbi:MAG: hypothetical protein ABIP42_06330, partial [Planctomycetota bacterium]